MDTPSVTRIGDPISLPIHMVCNRRGATTRLCAMSETLIPDAAFAVNVRRPGARHGVVGFALYGSGKGACGSVHGPTPLHPIPGGA